jgi:regulator of sigma E protease
MAVLTTILQVALLIFVVVMIFNVIIFVHELGHFLAGKWRGLKIDRFQIWFGTPIWKKEINGVQYGLGWIPAGGFVALPQMAPMEALEGGSKDQKPLPPITPLDKIIVALAGPVFSMLLALLSAVVVWKVGKPADFIPNTEVGYIETGSPAAKSGLQLGDKIKEINGLPVTGFAGSLSGITERIVLSRGNEIVFTVERPGVAEPVKLISGFKIEETKWYQRTGLREVGFSPSGSTLIKDVIINGPAADMGLGKGDQLLSVDGKKLFNRGQLTQTLEEKKWQPVTLTVLTAAKTTREVTLVPEKPLKPINSDPKIGILWDGTGEVDTRIIHPGPVTQVLDSLKMMWITITSVIARDSNIGINHLSGPVGIAKMQYQLLQMDDGWRRILSFMVLFNVNLAVLNMMPFPVLDGGHITLAILEKIFGRPVKAKPLEILQTACALGLITLMLFVTSKDIGDGLGRGESKGNQEIVFPAN